MRRNGWNRTMWDWDPWLDMRRFRNQMNRLLEGRGTAAREYPAVNVWVGPDKVALTAEIPGVDATDLDISVHGRSVTIRGKREPDRLAEGESYHRQERGCGEFVRTVQVPFDVDADAVEAELARGVLTLKLPRAQEDRPRRIAIQATA